MIKMIFSKKQIVGIIGTLLTMIGVFLPAFSMNTFDDLTLFNHGKGDGVIILGVCSFALILLLFRKFIAFILVTLVSSTIIGMKLYKFDHLVHDMKRDTIQSLTGNPFEIYGISIINSAQLRYGWMILCVGCCISLGTIFIRNKKQHTAPKPSDTNTPHQSIVHAAFEMNAQPYNETKACPYCAQSIRITAIKCKYCEKMLEET